MFIIIASERRVKKVMEMRKIKGKKAQVGLGLAGNIIMALLVLAVMATAVNIALANLKTSTGLTTDSKEYNETQSLIQNVTEGNATFFDDVGTWMTILGVVVLLLIISVIIMVVRRFGAGASPSTGL